MDSHPQVEQLMHDFTRTLRAFGALKGVAPGLHPGIEQSAIPLLFRLECQPLRVGALAEYVHTDISTVSRQVTSLVKADLVTKSADPADGRAQVLQLTDRGAEVTRQLRQQRTALIAAILRGWSDEKISDTATAMAGLADAIEAALHDDELPAHLPRPVSL